MSTVVEAPAGLLFSASLSLGPCVDGSLDARTIDLAPWTSVVPKLQAINLAAKGNLCVVAGVCYALHAIKQIKISEPCAVHMLIAPEEVVHVGFLEDETVKFYQEVFSSGHDREGAQGSSLRTTESLL